MLDRRGFLKVSGATAFAALFGGCERLPKKIVPFVIPPENHVLGESLWYASVCRQCPAGCGIVVRNSEGRAKKIEGNPLHPVNRGSCAPGDRRGSRRSTIRNGWASPFGWTARAAPESSGRLPGRRPPPPPGRACRRTCRGAVVPPHAHGSDARGTRNLVAARFMKAFGSPHRLHGPLRQDAHLSANESVYGVRDLPEHDIAGTRYLLSFQRRFSWKRGSPRSISGTPTG